MKSQGVHWRLWLCYGLRKAIQGLSLRSRLNNPRVLYCRICQSLSHANVHHVSWRGRHNATAANLLRPRILWGRTSGSPKSFIGCSVPFLLWALPVFPLSSPAQPFPAPHPRTPWTALRSFPHAHPHSPWPGLSYSFPAASPYQLSSLSKCVIL